MKAACENVSHGGFLDLWISHIKNVYDKYSVELDKLPLNERVNKLVVLNIKEQVKNVWKNPYIQKAWSQGDHIWVHGWLIKVRNNIELFIGIRLKLERWKRYRWMNTCLIR